MPPVERFIEPAVVMIRASSLHGKTVKPDIQAEISRMRALAGGKGGSAVLAFMEKRILLARVVRAVIANEPQNSDLSHPIKQTEND